MKIKHGFLIAILALLATTTLALAASSKAPFTPKGDRGIVGRWGRDMNGIVSEGNPAAEKMYTEYHFAADGTYRISGHHLGEEVNYRGIYRADGARLRLCNLYYLEKGHWLECGQKEVLESELTMEDGFSAFKVFAATYCRDLWWDFKSNCYRDPDDNYLIVTKDRHGIKVTKKDPVYKLFPIDEGEFEIKAIFWPKGKLIELQISLCHQIPNSQRNLFDQETALIKKSALKWLKNHKVSLKGIRVVYTDR